MLKPFVRYRGNNICLDEWPNVADTQILPLPTLSGGENIKMWYNVRPGNRLCLSYSSGLA